MKMVYDFSGSVAFITGAAGGIGSAIAERLAAESCNLVLFDMNEKGLTEVAENLRESVDVVVVQGDVSDTQTIRGALDTVIDRFHQVDFLINVAGVGVPNQFFDIPEEDWDKTIAVNLKGTFLTCQIVGEHMAKSNKGRIVNVASISGKAGSDTLAAYSSSKGGVILLTQSVSKALAPYGICVNAVCPGLVWTPMWKNTATWIGNHDPNFAGLDLPPEKVYDAVVKAMTPLGVPTETADIASAVAFLLSDEAKVITGQSINVDGGIEVH